MFSTNAENIWRLFTRIFKPRILGLGPPHDLYKAISQNVDINKKTYNLGFYLLYDIAFMEDFVGEK